MAIPAPANSCTEATNRVMEWESVRIKNNTSIGTIQCEWQRAKHRISRNAVILASTHFYQILYNAEQELFSRPCSRLRGNDNMVCAPNGAHIIFIAAEHSGDGCTLNFGIWTLKIAPLGRFFYTGHWVFEPVARAFPWRVLSYQHTKMPVANVRAGLGHAARI